MQDDEHLTADDCEELSRALRRDASILPSGLEQQKLLNLADSYLALAELKRLIARRTH
jgi:hypothetical protein